MNPEFLREGTSIEDFYHPPKTVIGQLDDRSGDAVAELYSEIEGPVRPNRPQGGGDGEIRR